MRKMLDDQWGSKGKGRGFGGITSMGDGGYDADFDQDGQMVMDLGKAMKNLLGKGMGRR